MVLIKGISGIRGTFEGDIENSLNPYTIIINSLAFGSYLQKKYNKKHCKIILGRDARISGKQISDILSSSLRQLGIDIVDLDLTTTPTLSLSIINNSAEGGIMITASHNPEEWNGLKFLSRKGEYPEEETINEINLISNKKDFEFTYPSNWGLYTKNTTALDSHIKEILNISLINKDLIKKRNFKIVVDAINSTGAFAVPYLLSMLGVSEVITINKEMDGRFSHSPEPIPENLKQLQKEVLEQRADLGIAIDPDVDRLVFVMENGVPFNEEYSLISIGDYVLRKTPGTIVSNLCSSQALKDITEARGLKYFTTAVGVTNVVKKMKEENAVFGGEGSGGIIYPKLQYNKDALVGIALFLSNLAEFNGKMTHLKSSYPQYYQVKQKRTLKENENFNEIKEKLKIKYPNAKYNETDGLKIEMQNEWLILRKSNTEPIIRIECESTSQKKAEELIREALEVIK